MMNVEQIRAAVDTVVLCALSEGANCSNCEYRSVDDCKQEAVEDIKNGFDEFAEFRKRMFNRCAAITHCNTCELCVYFEDCQKERTLNPI